MEKIDIPETNYEIRLDEFDKECVKYTGKVIEYNEQFNGTRLYQDESNGNMYEEFNEKCRVLFEFNINWRGCWDNRVYLIDDEYFGDEMTDIYLCYKFVEKTFKERLKKDFPKHSEFM